MILTGIDVVGSDLERLLGPVVEVAGMNTGLVNRVLAGEVRDCHGVEIPIFGRDGECRVAGELVVH